MPLPPWRHLSPAQQPDMAALGRSYKLHTDIFQNDLSLAGPGNLPRPLLPLIHAHPVHFKADGIFELGNIPAAVAADGLVEDDLFRAMKRTAVSRSATVGGCRVRGRSG